MDNFPLQAVLYGGVTLFLEPFAFGLSGFVLSYRINRSIWSKLFAIVATLFLFLLTDSVWPAWANRSAGMGVASSNATFNEWLKSEEVIGEAQFHNGEQSDLHTLFDLDSMDIGTGIFSILVAYHMGLVITHRKWREPKPIDTQ